MTPKTKKTAIIVASVLVLGGAFAATHYVSRWFNSFAFAWFEVRTEKQALLKAEDSASTEVVRSIPGKEFPKMYYLLLKTNERGRKKLQDVVKSQPDTKIALAIMGQEVGKLTPLKNLLVNDDSIIIGAFEKEEQCLQTKKFLDQLIRNVRKTSSQ